MQKWNFKVFIQIFAYLEPILKNLTKGLSESVEKFTKS